MENYKKEPTPMACPAYFMPPDNAMIATSTGATSEISFCSLLVSGGPTTRFFKGPTPMSSVTGFPMARSLANPPSKRKGDP